jgi:predicted transcriptional regulator
MLPNIDEIQKRRKLLNLNQKQLAKLSHVSQSYIAKIENKKIDPSYEKIKQILQVLDNEEKQRKTIAKANEIHTIKINGVQKTDDILKASQIMKNNDFSQIPVYEDENVIGSISLKVINKYISEEKDIDLLPNIKVYELMEPAFPVVDEDYPVEAVVFLLKYSPAVLTVKKGKILGIITNDDLLKLIVK